MKLTQLELNQKAEILKINLPYVIKERLHSMGVIEEMDIILKRKAPLGSPQIYEIMNTLIAIRNNVANKIKIQVRPKGTF